MRDAVRIPGKRQQRDGEDGQDEESRFRRVGLVLSSRVVPISSGFNGIWSGKESTPMSHGSGKIKRQKSGLEEGKMTKEHRNRR